MKTSDLDLERGANPAVKDSGTALRTQSSCSSLSLRQEFSLDFDMWLKRYAVEKYQDSIGVVCPSHEDAVKSLKRARLNQDFITLLEGFTEVDQPALVSSQFDESNNLIINRGRHTAKGNHVVDSPGEPYLVKRGVDIKSREDIVRK